jgi:hypothetical protein
MKDAFYFPHFSNARIDRKLRRVRKDLGLEGYGIYFMLLEVLREQKEFNYPFEDVDLLADEFGTSESKVQVVISNYKLFQLDEQGNFFSPKFNEYMIPYLEGKEAKRVAAIKGNHIKYGRLDREQAKKMSNSEILAFDEDWKSKDSRNAIAMRSDTDHNTITERSQSPRNASQSKVNESKVNESKEKKKKEKESKGGSLFFCLRNSDNTLSTIDIEEFTHQYEPTIYSVKRKHEFTPEELEFQIEEFFLSKCSFEFESSNHVKSTFMKFCEYNKVNTPKNKNKGLESKFSAETPNPNWQVWSFNEVPEGEKEEFIKWKKENR